MNCLDAVNLLLVGAPRGAFSFTFSNGENRSVLQLAQLLLKQDEASGAPAVSNRRDIVMRIVCALVEIEDTVTDDMKTIVDEASQRRVVPSLCSRRWQDSAARRNTKSTRESCELAAR